MAQTTRDVEQLVNDYVDAWHGDYSKLDVVAESVTVYDPGAPGGEIHRRDALETYIRDLREGFPDLRIVIDDMLATDEVVMAEWTITGTHEGEYNDIPPTDREVELTGMDKILVADGNIREHRIYFNLQELFEQLGLAE